MRTAETILAENPAHSVIADPYLRLLLNAAGPVIVGSTTRPAVCFRPNFGFYFVDLDPASPRYGCVKFTSSSLLSAGKYIYGDFDLYGIIPAADPSKNVAVSEMRLGQHHSRSPELLDVQTYINSRIGAPMVLHGAQESYGAEHSDEGIDIFCPDGKMMGAENAAEIGMLYDTQFKGRKLFAHDGPRDVVRGMFMTPA